VDRLLDLLLRAVGIEITSWLRKGKRTPKTNFLRQKEANLEWVDHRIANEQMCGSVLRAQA
jgi:hypothetical protein